MPKGEACTLRERQQLRQSKKVSKGSNNRSARVSGN
jgi:hypothetical protein